MSHQRITIRLSDPSDEEALRRLAALDSARLPSERPLLVGEVDQELWAALDVMGATLIADPFRRTAEVADLLQLRADQLRRRRGDDRRGARVPARPALGPLLDRRLELRRGW